MAWAIDYFIIGSARLNFFGTSQDILYSSYAINEYFLYVILCFLVMVFGYWLGGKARPIKVEKLKVFNIYPYITLLYFWSFLVVFGYGILINGVNYWQLDGYRSSFRFLFESRYMFLILAVIWLNNQKMSFKRVNFKLKILMYITLMFYFFVILMYQARSVIFEFLFLMFFMGYFRVKRDKFVFKYKFIPILLILPFIPNLFVIWRYWEGGATDLNVFQDFFKFEYLYLFNLLGFEYFQNFYPFHSCTICHSASLMIPSFIRDIIDIKVNKDAIYGVLPDAVGKWGGGFSFIIDIFINMGWFSILYFFVFAFIAGHLRKMSQYLLQTKNDISLSAFYVMYIYYSVIALRNDVGVYFKQLVFLLIFYLFLKLMGHYTRQK